jgi:phospholipase C
LWASTAIMVTFETKAAATTPDMSSPSITSATAPEFGALVISPFTTVGHISHTYADHVSILKFIEAN